MPRRTPVYARSTDRNRLRRSYPNVGQRSRLVLAEDAVTLLVDHLFSLGDRKFDGLFHAGVALGADEAVLLAFAADVLLDDTAGLELSVPRIRRRPDQEALVFDRLSCDRPTCGTAAEQTREERSQYR